MKELGTVVQMILVFVLVLGACWWFTSKFAKVSVRTSQSKYMKIIDRIMLGQDKYMGIVEVGSRYFIVSVTSGEIRILAELAEEDLKELQNSQEHPGVSAEFKNILDKIKREKDTKL